MRYLVITYYRKATGQMDEVVGVVKNLRDRDIQTCSVILDFKKSQVVKCSLEGTVVPKDWTRIRDFYNQHYSQIIDQLETANGTKATAPAPQDDPS